MGGSAQEWQTNIDDGLTSGSPIELSIVMTNVSGQAVTIGYEVVIKSG